MSATPFPLESLRTLAVAGPDARGFLQSQLSSDLDELSDTCGQFSAWHDPKGRVLAFFRVLPWRESYLLVMQSRLAATIRQRLGLFVLRARVTLEPGPPVFGLAGAETAAALAVLGLAPGGALLGAAWNTEASAMRVPAGWLIVGNLGAAVNAAASAAWDYAEVAAGIPEIYPETSGQFVAQMLNLDRIGAVSFTKGCYPGQEIVARAHHLGRVKRRARLFRARGAPPAPGFALSDGGSLVVRAAAAGDHCLVMAVVSEDLAGPFALSDGRTLEALPPAERDVGAARLAVSPDIE
jgi:tRNA-modifying protein YgfZ